MVMCATVQLLGTGGADVACITCPCYLMINDISAKQPAMSFQ
jgi:hypothetical protein